MFLGTFSKLIKYSTCVSFDPWLCASNSYIFGSQGCSVEPEYSFKSLGSPVKLGLYMNICLMFSSDSHKVSSTSKMAFPNHAPPKDGYPEGIKKQLHPFSIA